MRRTLTLVILGAVLLAASSRIAGPDAYLARAIPPSSISQAADLESTSEVGRLPRAAAIAVPATGSGAAADGAAPPTPDGTEARAPGSTGTLEATQSPPPDLPAVIASFLIAAGTSTLGTGPAFRYSVEVEPATGLDPAEVLDVVESALGDERSWVRSRTLIRTDDPMTARIRLVVATPETVDRLCATAGLDTAGIYSCWTGRFAALNAWRWENGARDFAELDDPIGQYRIYLVNHEFGHGLGYGHVACPAAGASAPVMMQQSKSTGACRPNGWPYP